MVQKNKTNSSIIRLKIKIFKFKTVRKLINEYKENNLKLINLVNLMIVQLNEKILIFIVVKY